MLTYSLHIQYSRAYICGYDLTTSVVVVVVIAKMSLAIVCHTFAGVVRVLKQHCCRHIALIIFVPMQQKKPTAIGFIMYASAKRLGKSNL